ncbi:hypothetical protein FACS1894167_12480 [Synergistales bacterium]|nr:hypothetical protein FACS1894167_12480 [Synergistales bacterium]
MSDSIYSNMSSFLWMCGAFGGCSFIKTPSFAAMTSGTMAAYENYALPRERAEGAEIDRAIGQGLNFFGKTPHFWMLFGENGNAVPRFERAGFSEDEPFRDMRVDTSAWRGIAESSYKADEIWSLDGTEGFAEKWGYAAWNGFDSFYLDEPVPPAFTDFARGLAGSADGGALLLALRGGKEGEFVSTGMLYIKDGLAGIHYVSVMPDSRGRGLGSRVIRALLRRGAEMGIKKAALIATPDGGKLYKKLGFSDTGEVRVVIKE